jgi:hypothetical protein
MTHLTTFRLHAQFLNHPTIPIHEQTPNLIIKFHSSFYPMDFVFPLVLISRI